MTLRERLPSEPSPVDFERFRDVLDDVRANTYDVSQSALYLRHGPRVDEAYKLQRMLIEPVKLQRLSKLAQELWELFDEVERSCEQVVRSPQDVVWDQERRAREEPTR